MWTRCCSGWCGTQKAALEVKDYRAAIAWATWTALRDILGKMMLPDILVGREAIDAELQKIIDERTTPYAGCWARWPLPPRQCPRRRAD